MVWTEHTIKNYLNDERTHNAFNESLIKKAKYSSEKKDVDLLKSKKNECRNLSFLDSSYRSMQIWVWCKLNIVLLSKYIWRVRGGQGLVSLIPCRGNFLLVFNQIREPFGKNWGEVTVETLSRQIHILVYNVYNL